VFNRPGRWPRQLLAFGAVGALLTLVVAGAALFSLASTKQISHELGQLSRAQRFHQDADMMHDALHADVADAEQAMRSGSPLVRDEVMRATTDDAGKLRYDLGQLAGLDLPPAAQAALDSVRQPREAYLTLAVQRARAVLAGRDSPAAQKAFGAAFARLVPRQATITGTLADTSAEVERRLTEQERSVATVVVLAAAGALAGWLVLVGMLSHAGRRLLEALGRETEQRAVAELLQRSLMPERLPQVPGLRLAARTKPVDPSKQVGGDWYDVISLPSGDVGLVVGDVVGHDLRAATAMGQLRASLRAFAMYETSPAAVLTQVNTIAGLLQVTDLTTCLYAVVNAKTRTVRWSSAGHLNPLGLRASGPGQVLAGDPGPPIGVSEDAVYVDRTCRLEPGGSLMLYTDGLIERRCSSITENLDRLEGIEGPHAGPEQLCDHVLEVLLPAGSPVQDDVTVLALQAA
jgi:serine phosphatase RsbU (regulator of sigma subunit)